MLWKTIGQQVFITFPKVMKKSWLPNSSLRCGICQGRRFPQSRLLSSGPKCSRSAPGGASPARKCYQEGQSPAASDSFLLNQENHQPEQLLSLRVRKPGEMVGTTGSLLYIYPKHFRLSKIALRKLCLFLSIFACENRFSTITDKD